MANNSRSRAAQARGLIEALADFFPACFFVFERRRRPLKIGIRDDLASALVGAITRQEIRLALAFYCNNFGYLRACVEGAERIGLNGGVAGRVSADEAKHCVARLLAQRSKGSTKKTSPAARSPVPASPAPRSPEPRRVSLADLRAAVPARREVEHPIQSESHAHASPPASHGSFFGGK